MLLGAVGTSPLLAGRLSRWGYDTPFKIPSNQNYDSLSLVIAPFRI